MEKKVSILVVDDDSGHRAMLKTLLKGWGYHIIEADDGLTAIERVKIREFDIVLMDNRMMKVSGLEALEEIRAINPTISVIIMTAFSSIEIAIEAIKKGAYDYITKPLDFDKLRLILKRAVEHVRLKEENRQLRENLGKRFDDQNIIGNSPPLIELMETIAQVAPTEATVLISGESGTGKEQIAGTVHFNSTRKNGPFIKINCAAITETLLESELFGHEKGAFTGADKRKEGRFLQANGGSLFLDEIGEMPLSMQVKLLRVLQEKELTRVGGDTVEKVDVRVIAATNKNLSDMVEEGSFREDLFYRLNVVVLPIPPLRDRKEDIPLLVQHFTTRFCENNNKPTKKIAADAMDLIVNYHWPGNVRELMNSIERAVILAHGETLRRHDFPLLHDSTQNHSPKRAIEKNEEEIIPLERVEREAILTALETTGNNKSETARRLGITRRTLHQKLKKYGVMP